MKKGIIFILIISLVVFGWWFIANRDTKPITGEEFTKIMQEKGFTVTSNQFNITATKGDMVAEYYSFKSNKDALSKQESLKIVYQLKVKSYPTDRAQRLLQATSFKKGNINMWWVLRDSFDDGKLVMYDSGYLSVKENTLIGIVGRLDTSSERVEVLKKLGYYYSERFPDWEIIE